MHTCILIDWHGGLRESGLKFDEPLQLTSDQILDLTQTYNVQIKKRPETKEAPAHLQIGVTVFGSFAPR